VQAILELRPDSLDRRTGYPRPCAGAGDHRVDDFSPDALDDGAKSRAFVG
jgi:hypothetical protein